MLSKSSIQKGRRFENFICEQIEKAGLGSATREIGSGSGRRKGDVFSSIPFVIEAKNQKSIQWWAAISQARQQAKTGGTEPDKWALVVRDPRTPETAPACYAVIDLWQWLELLKKNSEPKIKAPDRQLRWDIANLLVAAKKVLKHIE
jgi:hypothetical protein